jgi:hypothetical protein
MLWKKQKSEEFKIPEQYKKPLTLDEAKLYMDFAEKQLNESLDTGKIITERATNFLTLTAGVLIALASWSILRWEEKQVMDNLLTLSMWGCVALFAASVLLVFAITPRKYCIPGSTPGVIFNETLFNDSFTSEARQKIMAINLIEDYRNGLIENIARNDERWLRFKAAILIIILSPILFASQYLLFR